MWWVMVVWFRREGKCSVIAVSKASMPSVWMLQRRWMSGSLTGGEDVRLAMFAVFVFVSDPKSEVDSARSYEVYAAGCLISLPRGRRDDS